ncbi:MAG TPA: FAD-binding protein, partial [Candidatus Angelobacter sp.]|nr:FAD-binding protein [Candidatus Angelobacter sp.]
MSATEVSLGVARELRAICGDDNARERPAGGVYVSPASAEEVAAVLRLANVHNLSVGPAGGSTEYSAESLRTGIVLHTNRLTQVEHYDHADLTVGVGAGMTVAQLNAMARADNLMFAGDPPIPERCTVGGLLATSG